MRRLLLLAAILFSAPLTFAQTWGSIPADFVLSNNTASSPGTTMTLPIMTAASQTSSCNLASSCVWTAGGEGTGSPGLISNFSVAANQNACSNLGPITLNNSSTTFPTQSLNYNSIEFDATHNAQAGLQFSGSVGGITQLSGLMCASTPPFTNSGSDWDFWDFWATNGDYSVVQFNDTSCGTPASLGNYGVRIEHGHPTSHGSGANTCIHLVPQTAYLFSHYYNFATGQTYVSVWTTTGTLIGSMSFQTTQTSDTFGWMSFGNGEGDSSATPYYFNWMLLNWTTVPTTYFWNNTASTPQPPTNVKAAAQ